MILKKRILNLGLLMLTTSLQLGAATVNFADFDQAPVGRISQNEMNAAGDAAGNDGQINFPRRTYSFRGQINISRRGITLAGSVRGRTIFLYDGPDTGTANPSILGIKARNVVIRRIDFSGENSIEFPNRASDQSGQPRGLAGNEGLRASVGLEYSIMAFEEAKNLEVIGCTFRRSSVGIAFDTNVPPSGLRITNCQFTTNRGMLNALDNASGGGDFDMPRNFLITNADYVGRAGVTSRGITIDFGNSSGRAINARNSMIEGCNIRRMSNYNMDINRFSNYTIQDNDLNGGGAFGRVRFGHCLHFEDRGRNIRIRNNVLNQTVSGANESSSFVHIWTGGNDGLPSLRVANNNTFRGIARNIRIPN